MDLNSLPADYIPVTGEQLIRIRENENMFIDFGVTLNGTVSGKVFLDKNRNGLLDPSEQPLELVEVSLNNSKKLYTREDGSFYFEHIPLGEHQVSISAGSLPAGMRPARSEPYTVTVTKTNLDVWELHIPVMYRFD